MPQHDQIEIFETVERDFSRFPCLGPSKDRQFIMMYISGNPVWSYKATKVSSVASANTMPSSRQDFRQFPLTPQMLNRADRTSVHHISIGPKRLILNVFVRSKTQPKKLNSSSIALQWTDYQRRGDTLVCRLVTRSAPQLTSTAKSTRPRHILTSLIFSHESLYLFQARLLPQGKKLC